MLIYDEQAGLNLGCKPGVPRLQRSALGTVAKWQRLCFRKVLTQDHMYRSNQLLNVNGQLV